MQKLFADRVFRLVYNFTLNSHEFATTTAT